MRNYREMPAEYDYTVIGLDGKGGSTRVLVGATPLDQAHNDAIKEAFAIADSDTLKPYDIVYILSGDSKTIINHVRGARLTLQEILAGEVQQLIIPLT